MGAVLTEGRHHTRMDGTLILRDENPNVLAKTQEDALELIVVSKSKP